LNPPEESRGGAGIGERLANLPGAVRLRALFDAECRFLSEWIREPASIGSIAPTGKATARVMASHAPLDTELPVLELGPGTGAVTAAILEHGLPPGRLVSIEYSQKFHAYLGERFPGVHFIHGDAFDLATTLAGSPWRRFAAVISALPLLNFPKPAREKLIRDSLSLCVPGAPFVQLCYGPRPPVSAALPGLVMESSDWVVKNMPPARVFVYRRQDMI